MTWSLLGYITCLLSYSKIFTYSRYYQECRMLIPAITLQKSSRHFEQVFRTLHHSLAAPLLTEPFDIIRFLNRRPRNRTRLTYSMWLIQGDGDRYLSSSSKQKTGIVVSVTQSQSSHRTFDALHCVVDCHARSNLTNCNSNSQTRYSRWCHAAPLLYQIERFDNLKDCSFVVDTF